MERPKGKPKTKRGYRTPTDWLRFDAPFTFVSPLPFEECVSRLYRIEGQSTFYLRYIVEVNPVYNVYDDRFCEFHVRMGGTGIDIAGLLRAFGEETVTHVEGRAIIKLLNYLGVGLLFAVASLGFLCAIFPASFAWNASALCFILCFPLLAALVWLVDFSQRQNVLRLIQIALETKRSYAD